MTDTEKIDNLMDTQRMLVKRQERIAQMADVFAEQVGPGILLNNIRIGFERIARIARGSDPLSNY